MLDNDYDAKKIICNGCDEELDDEDIAEFHANEGYTPCCNKRQK